MKVTPIIRKEIADHLSNKRFPLLIALILLSGLATSYLGFQSIARGPIRGTDQTISFLRLLTGGEEVQTLSFVHFMGLFGPIVGIALSFDSINREISSGSMLKVLSNPIYRDSVILGKITAGLLIILLVTFSATGIVTGSNILLVGFGPTFEGVFRIVYFALASFLYVSLWFSIGLLFSVIFRRTTTSALASIALWIILSAFFHLIADAAAAWTYGLKDAILRISPLTLYTEVANILLNPEIRTIGFFYVYSRELRVPQPLSLDLSIALVWPSFSALIAGFVIILALSTLIFLKMEIRPSWA